MNTTTRQQYPVPLVGVSGIVFNRSQEVLLIRRNQAPARGLWSIPGGKVDAGESFTDACIREIKEETHLVTHVLSLVAVVERRIENFHYIVLDFLMALSDTENCQPIAQTDASEARWVSIEQLKAFELVPGLEEIIIRTYRGLRNTQTPGLVDPSRSGTDFILK